MTTITRFLIATAFLVVSFPTLKAAEKSAPAKPPNIVLILTDDHGWSQMSQVVDPRVPASASNYLETPNMNRLAAEGMRFTSGYSPARFAHPHAAASSAGPPPLDAGASFAANGFPPST